MASPAATATHFVPSAEAATDCQFLIGAVAGIHVAPEFVERKIGPPEKPTTTTSLVPSAEAAMEVQFVVGALVCVHVCAKT